MKKSFYFLFFVFSLLSASVMAQAHYENDLFEFSQGAFTFKTDYVLTDFAVRVASMQNENILDINNLSEIGFYKISSMSGHSTTLDGEPVWMRRNDGENITTNEQVTFHQGDKIGIYVKTSTYVQKENGKFELVKDAQTFTTTDGAIDGANSFKNNQRPENEDGLVYFSLYLDNNDIKQPTYQYALNGEASSGGNEESFGGQPLPGILLTLAIGGTAIAGVTKRRKKSKA